MIGFAALLSGGIVGIAVAAPRVLDVDGPLVTAAPCATPAPLAVIAALREGIPLRWAQANRLFPDIGLERTLVRRVVVRAATVGVCGGRVIAEDVTVRLIGLRGTAIEAVIATNLRPGVLLGVTESDVAVRPPAGILRVTARDGFTAYGAWELGGALGVRGVAPAASSSPSG